MTKVQLKELYEKTGKPVKTSLLKGDLIEAICTHMVEAAERRDRAASSGQTYKVPDIPPAQSQLSQHQEAQDGRGGGRSAPRKMPSIDGVRLADYQQQQGWVSPNTEVRPREEALEGIPEQDWTLMFLGTASCIPNITRGVYSVCLRRPGGIWMFDAGEGTQIQVQKSSVRPGKIRKIFVTHAHGDHTFGLPGILCLMGQTKDEDTVPVEIYGPEGIRDYIRACLQLTHSRAPIYHIVHELCDIPSFGPPHDPSRIKRKPINLVQSATYGEYAVGRQIYPDEDGVWTLCEEEDGTMVQAAAIRHTVKCVGYSIKEPDRPGTMKPEVVGPLINANFDGLIEAGFKQPPKVFQYVKNLPKGGVFTFPDGTKLRQEDAMGPDIKGRKVVILGDTCDAYGMGPLMEDADVLVHEATNAHLPPFDSGPYWMTERDTVSHGHSTPQIAGKTAKDFRAKRLVLTHFSPRYQGDDSDVSVSIMYSIEDQARKASGLSGNNVIAAWDLMNLPVPFSNEKEEQYSAKEKKKLTEDFKQNFSNVRRAKESS